MATLFMDNYQIYGVPSALLDGMYAEVGSQVRLEMAQGYPCLYFPDSPNVYIRKVLPAAYDTIFFSTRIRLDHLPSTDAGTPSIVLSSSLNTAVVTLQVDTTGRIVLYYGSGGGKVEVARSVSPVIRANTFHFVEMKMSKNGTDLSLEVRVDEKDTPSAIVLNNYTTQDPIPAAAQYTLQGSLNVKTWFTDTHVWDATGSRNNDFLGDTGVASLWVAADVETGWTSNPRHKIGDGVLDFRGLAYTGGADNPLCAIQTQDHSSFFIGSSDFTLETFVRFDRMPPEDDRASIISRWSTSNNSRSYDLSKCGPALNGGNVEFRISTDGSAGTVQTLISQPWEPETDRWYHLAVSRVAGETMLFIDGIMQGVPVSDVNSYYNGPSYFVIGGIMDNPSSNILDPTESAFYGWMDETRVTVGSARYSSDFTPTTVKFPRGSSDSDWDDVALIGGWDSSVSDESSYNHILRGAATAGTTSDLSVVVNNPNDGEYQYQNIDSQDSLAYGIPRDDTNISASLYFATGILTLGDNPANGDEVVIDGSLGTETYKFVSGPVSDPYDVLIGSDMEESLSNLITAINGGAGSGTIYGSGTMANLSVYAEGLPSPQMKVVALLAGSAGNSIAVSYSGDGAWDDSTLTGGADIPGPSSFKLTRMPPGVTTIRSAMLVTRAYKTESGPAKMKSNFIGPLGTVAEGSEESLSIEPAYHTDVFEEDPDTSGPITPATIVQGRIQFDRTE